MSSEISINESFMREYIDTYNIDDLVDIEKFSLNFIRQFKDRINWKIIFERIYFHYTLRTQQGKFLKTFGQFYKDYNEQIYKEFFREYD